MYGEGRNYRYLIGLGAVILLLFIVIIMIIRGGGEDKAKVPETKRELVSYASEENAVVSLTTVGPIKSAQEHEETQISVSNRSAVVDVMRGYDGDIVNSRSYPMTTESFREFLSALEKVNFTEGSTEEELKDDTGYCSTGQRYVFEIHQGASQIQRFWATSCGGAKTYRGDLSRTLNLFLAQIPDYSSITSDTRNNSLSL